VGFANLVTPSQKLCKTLEVISKGHTPKPARFAQLLDDYGGCFAQAGDFIAS
jgi:hypothetical protein